MSIVPAMTSILAVEGGLFWTEAYKTAPVRLSGYRNELRGLLGDFLSAIGGLWRTRVPFPGLAVREARPKPGPAVRPHPVR